MQIYNINRLSSDRRRQLGEAFRFILVGIIATILQATVYSALITIFKDDLPKVKEHFYLSVFMTVGYVVSFVFNFIASTHYTFKVKANAKRGAGFAFSHVVNWSLQMALLNFFLWLGLTKMVAQVPMFCICIPTNFLLVRFFLKEKNEKSI